MNIGIYLGTFNPPHIGHLNCLYQALDTKVVDKIVVVPAFKNPWKAKPEDAFDPNNHDGMSLDSEHDLRVKLCKAMFKDLIKEGKVYVSDIEYEIWRQQHKYAEDCVYSWETLNQLKNCPEHWLAHWEGICGPDEKLKEKIKFFLVTTVETLVTIPDWVNGSWILASFPVLAMSSKDLEEKRHEYVWKNKVSQDRLNLVSGMPTFSGIDIPIHSTDIRDRFLKFKTIRPYVNEEVEKELNNKRTEVTKLYTAIAKLK